MLHRPLSHANLNKIHQVVATDMQYILISPIAKQYFIDNVRSRIYHINIIQMVTSTLHYVQRRIHLTWYSISNFNIRYKNRETNISNDLFTYIFKCCNIRSVTYRKLEDNDTLFFIKIKCHSKV